MSLLPPRLPTMVKGLGRKPSSAIGLLTDSENLLTKGLLQGYSGIMKWRYYMAWVTSTSKYSLLGSRIALARVVDRSWPG